MRRKYVTPSAESYGRTSTSPFALSVAEVMHAATGSSWSSRIKGCSRENAGSAIFQKAYSQLTKKYIPEQAGIEHLAEQDYIGIAIDGTHYAFVFFEENGTHRHTELLPF
jgi:hypothetical protein